MNFYAQLGEVISLIRVSALFCFLKSDSFSIMACRIDVDDLGYDCFGGIPDWFTGEVKFVVLTEHRVTGVNF